MNTKSLLVSLFIIVCIAPSLPGASVSPLQKVVAKENSAYHRKNIQNIIKKMDQRYGNLYKKLKSGEKITVFFDPAHGKLRSRNWQGDVTWRQSTTGKPEEFYSIPLSRNLYRYLVANKYIRVASTRNYMQLLRGERDNYYNIPFSTTTKLAGKTDAFIIISSHLNNVSPVHKADGKVNMYGIHITCDKYGTRYLSHVKHVSRGFLTLYNTFDGSGFCRNYAEELKKELIAIDMYPNGWGKGVVADGRFTYFTNYPLSVIYETAFISNPVEERFLRIPKNQRLIAKAQYNSLLESIASQFGVDISGTVVRKRFQQPKALVESIALSRISLYYLKHKHYDAAQYACRLTAQHTGNRHVKTYYTQIAEKVEKASAYIAKAENNMNTPRTYGTYMLKAGKALGGELILRNMRSDIYARRNKRLGIQPQKYEAGKKKLGAPPRFQPLSVSHENHSIDTPFIVTVKPGQNLEDAVEKSLAPHGEIQEKIYASFDDVRVTKVKWVRHYSKKKQKYYWKKKQYSIRKQFVPGIYIVRLNKDYSVHSVKNVERVEFDPKKYQNHEYFKNSSLAAGKKVRAL